MPRLFFHIRTAFDLVLDPDGSDLPDLDAAKNKALVGLRQLMVTRLHTGHSNVQQIEIADQAGQILATVRLEDALKSMQ